jgi:hypothetical protein
MMANTRLRMGIPSLGLESQDGATDWMFMSLQNSYVEILIPMWCLEMEPWEATSILGEFHPHA